MCLLCAVGACEARMHQADFFLFKFHHLFASLFLVGFVLIFSAVVTVAGANSVLDGKKSYTNVQSSGMSDSTNAVAAGMSDFMGGVQAGLISAGRSMYGACHSVTMASAESGRAMGRFGVIVARGAGNGLLFVGKSVGSAVLFTGRFIGSSWLFTGRLVGNSLLFTGRAVASGTLAVVHAPGKVVSAASRASLASVIRPADDTDKPLPTIDTKTSAAALADLKPAEKRKALDRRAEQLAANEGLHGKAIAGDPAHGRYPTKWDAPVMQDSRLDNWGMYNRECVSYTAWKVYETFGHMPYWGGVGNANQWPADARAAGIPTGSTPKVHSVAVSMRGYYGHTMWVEKVKGNKIYVSQYNYDLQGRYSEMWVDASNFTYIYFK